MVAERDGEIVGSVFAARWGAFGVSAHSPSNRASGITASAAGCSRPVLERSTRWYIRQAGCSCSRKPQTPRPVPEARLLARCADRRGRQVDSVRPRENRASSRSSDRRRKRSSTSFSTKSKAETRSSAGSTSAGRSAAVADQQIGDCVLLRGREELEGVRRLSPWCRKRGGQRHVLTQVRSRSTWPEGRRALEALLDGCEAFAVAVGMERLVAEVDTVDSTRTATCSPRGSHGADRRLHVPSTCGADLNTSADYVLDDLR